MQTSSISRQRCPTALFMSSASSKTEKRRVVYQKVVKSPTDASPLFLGYLVEYLQDRFELPDRLPMVYESVSTPDHEEGEKCIQSWDSPMSPCADFTRLDLEVVAIYTDNDTVKQSVPSMAMVVVRKVNPQSTTPSMPSPMMKNFFEESERLILKALDRGLDDFMAGKIPMEESQSTTTNPHTSKREDSLKTAQDAMIEEMLEDAAVNHPSVPQKEEAPSTVSSKNDKNRIVDADFSRVQDEGPSTKKETKKETTFDKKNPSAGGKDFAVEAAKRAAKKRGKEKTADYAVAAAKKLAKKQKEKKKKTTTPKSSSQQPDSSTTPAKAGINASRRAFRTTFSTPKAYEAKQKQNLEASANAKTMTEVELEKQKAADDHSSTDLTSQSTTKTELTAKMKTKSKRKRKLNLTVLDENGEEATDTPKAKKQSSKPKPPKKAPKDVTSGTKPAPSDMEIMQTAQDVMAELAEQGSDMSAEELLQDVLKFGEKQDQKDQVGSGFVTGAFEKAKELLREQKRDRDERVAKQVAKDVASNSVPLTGTSNSDSGPQVKERVITSEEEELKQMFEAGERIADGRISLVEDTPQGMSTYPKSMTDEDQQAVDELIAGDKGISDHARILDDELAELEVRIRQTPGEEHDGPPVGKPFDILSGPEVYNPNVDPESAVNWPGALPGTKSSLESTLPKELADSVKQAKFAAEVLQKLEVREEEDSGVKTYFVGNRELSQSQVEGLQTVVQEAVEIGIIPNPLVLLEERSRLQMVLDELWEQPPERVREIVSNYKELLLSDNFVTLIKERLEQMAERDLESLRQRESDDDKDMELETKHARERELLGQLVVDAQLLLKEARALGAELEAQHIEVIRSICKVAMDPSHTTEEETATALTDVVRDMRPLFDDMFVSYLKYAVAEEEGRLARAGVLDDPEHNQWLFVLKIVQQGVYAEIAKGINRYIEHIWYILRMKTALERKMLLEKLVDVLPTLDVRPFVRVVDNIVGSLGEAARGEFDGAYELGKMTNKLLQLHRDMKEILPPERIAEMSRDADEWAAKRKEQMLEARRLTKKRLKAARETEEYDEEIESMGRRGEMERFD